MSRQASFKVLALFKTDPGRELSQAFSTVIGDEQAHL
jgi:hypothetical protein